AAGPSGRRRRRLWTAPGCAGTTSTPVPRRGRAGRDGARRPWTPGPASRWCSHHDVDDLRCADDQLADGPSLQQLLHPRLGHHRRLEVLIGDLLIDLVAVANLSLDMDDVGYKLGCQLHRDG